MLENKPTDILAADQLAPYVRPITPGQTPHPISLMDETCRPYNMADDHVSGKYLAVVFVPNLETDKAKAELAEYQRRADKLEALGAKVLIVTATSNAQNNKAAKREQALSFPILGDANGGHFASYGLHKRGETVTPTELRTVIITPYRQIRCFWDIEMTSNHAQKAEELISGARLAEEQKWTAPHAPVLIVPNVLTPQECTDLIREFDAGGPLKVNRPKPGEATQSYKIPTYEHGRQDRIDHVITNPQILQFLDERLHERVMPAVKHAYAFDVTRREDLHIARYTGERGGTQMGHRDNRTATFHRRFALSLNLNDDYEGGEVAFREFSERGYKNPAGSALVFSSSLLHEVTETTQGVRFTLISHFFNDASVQAAQAR